MKNLYHQTSQAFYFSLIFYLGASLLLLLKVSIAPILFSLALLVSMIWVFLVIREIIFFSKLFTLERVLLILFIIVFNIIAGLAYFYLIRKNIIKI